MAHIGASDPTLFYRDFFPYMTRRTEGGRRPFFAAIEITSKCNFQCVHCQVYSPRRKREMTTQEILSALDQLADMGTFGLVITGGEPLTRPDFFQILAHAKKREFAIQLCTNASLITRGIAERLADFYLMDVLISIYGMDEATYRAVTGARGVFRRVFDHVKLLVDTGVRVYLRMPLMSANIGQVDRLERFARRIGVSCAAMPSLHARFDRCQDPLRHLPRLDQMEKFFRTHPQYAQPTFFIRGSEHRVCTAPNERLAITSEGDVIPCPLLRGGANLRTRSLRSIIKNEPLFKRIPRIRWKDLPRCTKCKALAYCRPCPGIFHLEEKSLTKTAVATVCRLAWLKKRLHEQGDAR